MAYILLGTEKHTLRYIIWRLLFQTIEIFNKSIQIHSYLCICTSQVNEPIPETLHPTLACLHVLCLVYLLLFKSAASFASLTNLGFKTNELKKILYKKK